jgi:pimeloyl-ACP methyl ester carboxylesterase
MEVSMSEPVIFLPGIIMPAAQRYAPLLAELGEAVRAVTKDLEVYSGAAPPAGYGIETEIAGISRAAERAGFARFHLYGHSGGGACALAYVARHGDRVLTLALDEPASDFSPVDRAALRGELLEVGRLAESERLAGFLRMQLAPGVEPPAPPPGDPPPWMSLRPRGIEAFTAALDAHLLEWSALQEFGGPVYFSHGSRSNPRWLAMRERLRGTFARFTAEEYEGLHHLATSHQREPARVADALRHLWANA